MQRKSNFILFPDIAVIIDRPVSHKILQIVLIKYFPDKKTQNEHYENWKPVLQDGNYNGSSPQFVRSSFWKNFLYGSTHWQVCNSWPWSLNFELDFQCLPTSIIVQCLKVVILSRTRRKSMNSNSCVNRWWDCEKCCQVN